MSESKTPVVLVAEDEPLLNLHLSEELSTAGYEVCAAGNGDEAMWQIREFGDKLAAAVLDVGLGVGPGGYEVAQYLRAKRLQLPIIFTTSDPAAPVMTESLQPALHLEKPYEMEDVRRALEDFLAGA